MARTRTLLAVSLAALLGGCGDTASLGVAQGVGPSPTLPEPTRTLFPTVHIAQAVGWPAGRAPTPAQGLAVNAFATGLEHPRWVYTLPNGDVLVAESAAPPKPEGTGGGIRGFFMGLFMRNAGSEVPSANRITLLRDGDGDGVAETRSAYITGLNSPIGMTLVGSTLYVANADALVAFPYDPSATRITASPRRIAALPAGRNHHWTKTLTANADGSRLYVGVGSNSNVAEHGLAEEEGRAAIWEFDPASGQGRVFASGLRNPVGIAFLPGTNDLFTVVNERDELGSDLVPDYLTRVQPGAFYGWPWSYWGDHVDSRVEPPNPDMVGRAIRPDYALDNHVAPLGLTFSAGARLGPAFASGAFIGLHGSWNRRPRSGYSVIYVPFVGGRPSGMPVDVLTGFVNEEGEAMGRPVGVVVSRDGSLLVADDVGNTIWRVSAPR